MVKNNVLAEKYRPKTFDEVVGQEHITPTLRAFVKNRNLPHILFSGKAGTGKTSLAKVIARELYGEKWKQYFLEINASDDRGIDVVREKIKGYARVKTLGEDFKIIFLDEADAITPPAQHALRRVIEMYSSKCRFILSCNYPNKIINPIKDRCVLFRFKGINPEDMESMLTKIAKKEEIDINPSAIHVLALLSRGSMRTALNTLDRLKSGGETAIDDSKIYDVMAYVNDDDIRALLILVREGDNTSADECIDNLLNTKVYTPEEILESLWRLISGSTILSKESKLDALERIGDVEFRISIGSMPFLQLKAFCIRLIKLYNKSVVK